MFSFGFYCAIYESVFFSLFRRNKVASDIIFVYNIRAVVRIF